MAVRDLSPSEIAAVRSAFAAIYERGAVGVETWRPQVGLQLAVMRRCNGILNAAARGTLATWLRSASDTKLAHLVDTLTAELASDLPSSEVANCRVALQVIARCR